jgi:hypothetical protein
VCNFSKILIWWYWYVLWADRDKDPLSDCMWYISTNILNIRSLLAYYKRFISIFKPNANLYSRNLTWIRLNFRVISVLLFIDILSVFYLIFLRRPGYLLAYCTARGRTTNPFYFLIAFKMTYYRGICIVRFHNQCSDVVCFVL